jgi:hypothetical protein
MFKKSILYENKFNLVKMKTSTFIQQNIRQQKRSGTIFVKTQDGIDRIFNYIKDSRNESILQKLYEGTPYLSQLVPFHILKEFKEMKRKNQIVNQSLSEPVVPHIAHNSFNHHLHALPGFDNQRPKQSHENFGKPNTQFAQRLPPEPKVRLILYNHNFFF